MNLSEAHGSWQAKDKESIGSYGDISLTSRYFRIAAGVWVYSGGLGEERNIKAENDFIKGWKKKALPFVELKKAELEEKISSPRMRGLNLPLLKYGIPLWTVSEEEIIDSKLPAHIAGNRQPFGYIAWFEIKGLQGSCAAEFIFSSLPPKRAREQLIKTLEKVLGGKEIKEETRPAAVKIKKSAEKTIFGEYTPKETPDTVYDYLPNLEGHEKYEADLKKVPPLPGAAELFAFTMQDLENLKPLLLLFDRYQKKAVTNPGKYVEGDMLLGAPPREYRPSGEETVLSEIGGRIKKIVERTPREELLKYLKKENIRREKIEYRSFIFSHADVMGSGRFFYASDPIKETVWFMREGVPAEKNKLQ